MDNISESIHIAAFHTAFANLRVMTASERPVDVDVAFVGSAGTSLKIQITTDNEKTMLFEVDIDYVAEKLFFNFYTLPYVDPKYLTAFAYATRFVERAYNLVKTHRDFVSKY